MKRVVGWDGLYVRMEGSGLDLRVDGLGYDLLGMQEGRILGIFGGI